MEVSMAEWFFVMQSSAGRRVVCTGRGGLSSVCFAGILYPSNPQMKAINSLVFWCIAVTLLRSGRDFSENDFSTFKKTALTSALDCRSSPSIFLSICTNLKMNLFCETSSLFDGDNVRSAASLRDFLNFWTWQRQKRSSSARRPKIFKLTTSKTNQSCETSFKNGKLTASCHCALRYFHSIFLKYRACHEKVVWGHMKCCTCHAKSSWQTCRSDPESNALTSQHVWLMCLLSCACHATCIFADPLQMPLGCHRFWKCSKNPRVCSLLARCGTPRPCHKKPHLNLHKWSGYDFFYILTLRATTACNFSSLIWPDVSSPAALARLLFNPPEPQKLEKTQWIATFLPFRAPASSFFSLFLFSYLFSSSLRLAGSSHLCFSTCRYCRKFDFQTSFKHCVFTYAWLMCSFALSGHLSSSL